ncbi:MAG: hypothetical protein ACYDC2_08605, partial [Solirubrobacteraceae bacterium]
MRDSASSTISGKTPSSSGSRGEPPEDERPAGEPAAGAAGEPAAEPAAGEDAPVERRSSAERRGAQRGELGLYAPKHPGRSTRMIGEVA